MIFQDLGNMVFRAVSKESMNTSQHQYAVPFYTNSVALQQQLSRNQVLTATETP